MLTMHKIRTSKSNRILANIDLSAFESQFFPGGRGELREMARHVGVSAPTMRKMLARTYGDRVVFRRGRTGGTLLLPKGASLAPAAPVVVGDVPASTIVE